MAQSKEIDWPFIKSRNIIVILSLASILKMYSKFVLPNWTLPGQMLKLVNNQ